jgi:hypothetical protein
MRHSIRQGKNVESGGADAISGLPYLAKRDCMGKKYSGQ